MPCKQGGNSNSNKGGGSSYHGQYTYRGGGTNSQGDHYCNRDYGKGRGHSYHYSNADGSYYYRNPDRSTYYNSGKGTSVYTAPNGKVYRKTT